jgi:ABC-type multidrug transport system permease subunit
MATILRYCPLLLSPPQFIDTLFNSVPLSNQLQVPFINMRNIYEIRERPSRMYSWTALVTSQMLIELPWNIFGSFILFICWYWTVGFENSRAGYTFITLVLAFPVYYSTFGQVGYLFSRVPSTGSDSFSQGCRCYVTYC